MNFVLWTEILQGGGGRVVFQSSTPFINCYAMVFLLLLHIQNIHSLYISTYSKLGNLQIGAYVKVREKNQHRSAHTCTPAAANVKHKMDPA